MQGLTALKIVCIGVLLSFSSSTWAQADLVPGKEFVFPPPEPFVPEKPATFFQMTTGPARAARLLTSGLFAAAVGGAVLASASNGQAPLGILLSELAIPTSVSLLSFLRGGRGAFGWTLLASYTGFALGSFAFPISSGPAALIPGLLFAVLGNEISSFINERELVVSQELDFIQQGPGSRSDEEPDRASLASRHVSSARLRPMHARR